MAALEAQRICGARWQSEPRQANESFANFTPLAWTAAEGSDAPADGLLGAICVALCLLFSRSCFFFPPTRLYGLSRDECRFALSSSRVLEYIQGGVETRPRQTMGEPALGHTGSVVKSEG
ncbi:hypothetical protein QQF64_018221 [Cirrhinus molitorella]|uniref:Uncharacterized protein n=1 Tax=Cirrhinus molitorella TaxID=172907 RepID=A0ABR3LKW4_9TELE